MTVRWPVLLLLTCTLACATSRPAAPPEQTPLYREILAQDTAMFAAFNAHNTAGLMSYFAPDVEFFHDKDGLRARPQLQEGFTRLFANNTDLTRQLVPGTVSVYPVPGYGAIQTGAHRFCHTEHGKADCGVFQFTNVWRKNGERWEVTRLLSYGH